jgi:hypothetical protein
MPAFEPTGEAIRRVVTCARCGEEGVYILDLLRGDFSYECPCTEIFAPSIHTGPVGPGELRVCTLPHRMLPVRPSRRTLSIGVRGRLWRQLWHCELGAVSHSGNDYLAVRYENPHLQTWAGNFEQAYYSLTGEIWRPEEGAV